MRSWASVVMYTGAGYTASVVGGAGYTSGIAGGRDWVEPTLCLC